MDNFAPGSTGSQLNCVIYLENMLNQCVCMGCLKMQDLKMEDQEWGRGIF